MSDNAHLVIAIQDLTREIARLRKVKEEGIELAKEIEANRRSYQP